ncbi:hypothetical protein [Dyadobacter sp. CY326]|uniref:hypothetical protein n=1 Tax=Dyadobacter sp. CY326 TaxID=2907300 RepID=UPI001F1E1666|nr:hypothetical protein [Dyadobacter sp. CY326]MCE7063719.1 hypothetical protein [Dyadobacter sp. CY326]
MRGYAVFALIFLSIGACNPREGWRAGIPITSNLIGTWRLEKIVTPTRTLIDKQIGYSEILKIRNEGGFDIDETFKNDTLIETRYWRRNSVPIAKTEDLTVLVTYRYDIKRFYKMHETVSQPTILEASAYLSEIGGANDTVKFFYKEVW